MHIIWFRDDLRLTDNPALTAAVNQANQDNCPLIALFIRCPEQDEKHHRAPAQADFIDANIADLIPRLQKINISSMVKSVPLFDYVPAVFESLLDIHAIKKVFFSRNYLLNEQKRDQAVIELLQQHQVTVQVKEPAYLLSPKSIEKNSGGMYHVFTPYKKQFIQQIKNSYESPLTMPDQVKNEFLGELQGDSLCVDWQHSWWPIGESAARQRLCQFVDNQRYHKLRDYPAISGTSKLSPYLALGIISARQCLAQALKQQGESAFQSTWVSELIWREFYHDLVAFYPRLVKHKTFKTDAMDDWHYDEAIVKAWKTGHTGFPIIDAGMRQLKQEHWMHNRVRMLTASFLTKLCLHDWRIGEQHFMEHLIDGDFASNNGGWQWSSATGCDAAPYFRIFNPTTQSQKFDEQGEYIRQYVPELKELSNKEIHNPGEQQRRDCDYPAPIIDYKQARVQALGWFKSG